MSIELTERAEKEFDKALKINIALAYSKFPELQNKKVVVGFLKDGKWENGNADRENFIIKLKKDVDLFTVAHELTHLVQMTNGIPSGEVSCDIYTLARDKRFIPKKRKDGIGFLPYLAHYGITDADTLHRLCKEALKIREGNRKYIYWLDKQLKELAKSRGLLR